MSPESPTLFIVLMTGRTGSTLLVEALDSHPGIRARGEIHKHNHAKSTRRQLTRIRRHFASTTRSVDADGFKLKLKDIGDEAGLAKLLGELDIHVIHLQRRNRVKHAVSLFNAVRLFKATQNWNLYSEEDQSGPFSIDPAAFEARIQKVEREGRNLTRYVATLDRPTFVVAYEDLLTRRDETLDNVFEFSWSAGAAREKRRRLKNTPDDLRLIVENFDELREAYAGTEYQAMFDEVESLDVPEQSL